MLSQQMQRTTFQSFWRMEGNCKLKMSSHHFITCKTGQIWKRQNPVFHVSRICIFFYFFCDNTISTKISISCGSILLMRDTVLVFANGLSSLFVPHVSVWTHVFLRTWFIIAIVHILQFGHAHSPHFYQMPLSTYSGEYFWLVVGLNTE